MKGIVEERAVELGEYIIAHKATVRAAAKEFGISKSTVHMDVSERLRRVNPQLYQEVREQVSHGRTQAQLDREAFLERIRPYYQAWYNSWLENVELDPFYRFNSRN